MAKAKSVQKKRKLIVPKEVVPSNFTRSQAVGLVVKSEIEKGNDSIAKTELIEKGDELYANVKGKKKNPYEATWLSRVAIGTLVGLGLAEDSKDTVYFKPALKKLLVAKKK